MDDPIELALRPTSTLGATVDPIEQALNPKTLANYSAPVVASPSHKAPSSYEGTEADLYQGIGENALHYLSSAVAAPVSGLVGLAGGAAGLLNGEGWDAATRRAAGMQQSTQGALTYEPASETGKDIAAIPSNAIDVARRGLNAAGALEAKYSPFGGDANAGNKITSPGQTIGDIFYSGQRLSDKVLGTNLAPVAGAIGSTLPAAAGLVLGSQFGKGASEGADTGTVPGAAGEVPLAGQGSVNGVSAEPRANRITPPPSIEAATPETKAALSQGLQNGAQYDPKTIGRVVEAESLPVPVKLTAGQASQDLGLLSKEQNMRAAHPELANQFNAQNQALVDNVAAIKNIAAPDITATNMPQIGQGIIDSYLAKDEALKTDISAKYQALADANGGDLPVDGQSFVTAADAALKKQMKGRYVPPAIAGDLEDLRDGGQMTLEQFENMRTNLAAEARKAERAGDGNAAGAVNIVRNTLESLPMTGEAADIKPLADAARQAARARFDTIASDPAYKAAINGTVAPDDFVQRFVVNGKVDKVASMKANLADDPLAQQHMAAGAIDYLGKRAGLKNGEGNFSQDGYNSALYGGPTNNGLAPKLDQLFTPEVAQHVESLGGAAKSTQFQPRGASVNNSNTFVAAAGNVAASAAEGAANVAAHGVPIGTWVRKGIGNRMQTKQVQQSLNPLSNAQAK